MALYSYGLYSYGLYSYGSRLGWRVQRPTLAAAWAKRKKGATDAADATRRLPACEAEPARLPHCPCFGHLFLDENSGHADGERAADGRDRIGGRASEGPRCEGQSSRIGRPAPCARARAPVVVTGRLEPRSPCLANAVVLYSPDSTPAIGPPPCACAVKKK